MPTDFLFLSCLRIRRKREKNPRCPRFKQCKEDSSRIYFSFLPVSFPQSQNSSQSGNTWGKSKDPLPPNSARKTKKKVCVFSVSVAFAGGEKCLLIFFFLKPFLDFFLLLLSLLAHKNYCLNKEERKRRMHTKLLLKTKEKCSCKRSKNSPHLVTKVSQKKTILSSSISLFFLDSRV